MNEHPSSLFAQLVPQISKAVSIYSGSLILSVSAPFLAI